MADYPTVQIIKGRQTAEQTCAQTSPRQPELLGYRGQAQAVDSQTSLKCSRSMDDDA